MPMQLQKAKRLYTSVAPEAQRRHIASLVGSVLLQDIQAFDPS